MRNGTLVAPIFVAAALAAGAAFAQQDESQGQPNESNAVQAGPAENAPESSAVGGESSRSESNAAKGETDIALADKAESETENVNAGELQRCIQLQRIDHTDVVDDSTILFYMRDGTILRNNLPLRCPDLKNQDRFMYRVSLPQLCDVDVITVLNDIGGRFWPGASCGLGKFQEISKEAADEIKRVAERTEKEKRK